MSGARNLSESLLILKPASAAIRHREFEKDLSHDLGFGVIVLTIETGQLTRGLKLADPSFNLQSAIPIRN